jgi:hypothetical protein
MRESMRARLEAAAERHGISMNAEILMRLDESFELDALKRELEIERQYLRDANKQLAERETGYLERERRLTDYLLQLTSPKVRVPSPEEKS